MNRRHFALLATTAALAACGLDLVGTEATTGPDASAPDGAVPDAIVTPTDDATVDNGDSSQDASIDAAPPVDDAGLDATIDADSDASYTLTVNVTGVAGGTVTSDVGGIACPGTCTATVISGTSITLTAAPGTEEALREWTGDCKGRTPGNCVLSMTAPKTVNADFDALTHYMHSGGTLYSVNGTTGASSAVANFGGGCSSSSVNDLAIDRRGNAFLVTDDNPALVYAVNLTNAMCGAQEIGQIKSNCNGLAFAPDPTNTANDALFAACGNDLWRFDTTAGTSTKIGDMGATSSGDLVWVQGHGMFITIATLGDDDLESVNLSTAALTLVGTTGESGVYGLGWHNGSILGYEDGKVLKINIQTGAATTLATNSVDTFGAASGP